MADFSSLQLNPANAMCVDCGRRGCQWASVNNGVFVCLECSGRHRSLGTHISFVRSTTMDGWSQKQFKFMQQGGNSRFLEVMEKYQMAGLDIPTKYGSQACQWYRQVLRAEIDGEEIPEAPSLEEGAKPIVYKPRQIVSESPRNFSSAPQEPEPVQQTSWLDSFVSKATGWANQAKESIKDAHLVDSLKTTANSLYDKSVKVGNQLYDKSKEVGTSVVNKSKDVGSTIVDKSKEVGTSVVNKSKDVGNTIVDKSKEVGTSVVNKSKDVGSAIVDKSKEVGSNIYDKGNEIIHPPERKRREERKDSLDEMMEELAQLKPTPKLKLGSKQD